MRLFQPPGYSCENAHGLDKQNTRATDCYTFENFHGKYAYGPSTCWVV